MHVQSISAWAPPAVGPYAQCNKMHSLMFVAGAIGLYPPLLEHCSPDIVLQYRQIKHNFNQTLREIVKNDSIVFQNLAKAVIVYISDAADSSGLIPYLQKDLAFVKEAAVLLRVPALPLGSLVEVELQCENNEKVTSGLSCQQFFYNADQVTTCSDHLAQNTNGEVFYVHSQVER